MLHIKLFTDGSVNTQRKVGYGAYLVITDPSSSLGVLKDSVKTKRFAPTSSTKLELQTLLWALTEIRELATKDTVILTVYTDSQNILSLPSRRSRLEQNDYFSNNHKRLNNFQLYQAFYRSIAGMKYELVKVSGHKKSNEKNEIDIRFALVDKASRRALRDEF